MRNWGSAAATLSARIRGLHTVWVGGWSAEATRLTELIPVYHIFAEIARIAIATVVKTSVHLRLVARYAFVDREFCVRREAGVERLRRVVSCWCEREMRKSAGCSISRRERVA